MIGRLFRRAKPQKLAVDQRVILADVIDRSLDQRRVGREERQAAAREREARKFHDAFTRDPLIRATRNAITKGDRTHV